jgi:hypothetical protein
MVSVDCLNLFLAIQNDFFRQIASCFSLKTNSNNLTIKLKKLLILRGFFNSLLFSK